MRYYHMSLNDNSEIHNTDLGICEKQVGSLLSEFLNINWEDLRNECAVFSKYHVEDGNLSKDFADWYKSRVAILGEYNPALEILVLRQLPGVMKNLLCEYGNYTGLGPEWTFVNNISNAAYYDIQAEYVRRFAQDIAKKLSEIAYFKKGLWEIVNAVLDNTQSDKTIIMRYIEMRNSESYQILITKYYPLLNVEYLLDKPNVDKRLGTNKARTSKNQILRSYFATDSIEALVLWEFDYMAANDIPVRRCEYCGKYFRPFSRNTIYCDNVVEGEKTCKEIGAKTKHQHNIESNDAKKLYRKVNNRLQMYASRNEGFNSARSRYLNWKNTADNLLKNVESGEITYDEFEKAININSSELVKFKID